ncbi:MAG: S8 family serine peptidase [Burkholderiales bacterium]|nr:S8 family serine peptidase [Burkholderiales bacterium]
MSDSKRAKKQPRPTQHGLPDVDPLLSGSPKLEGRQNPGRARRKAVANSITFESIEPRILLSSDPFAMASPAASASYTASDWTDSTPLIALSQDLPPLPIPAAGNPVEGNAAEEEPLLTASSAQPATQSQLSITKVEVTLDPDGRVKAGTSILITAKNTSESTFYGQVWAYLMLWNNENRTGPSQALLNSYYNGFIRLEEAKIGSNVVDISDNNYRVTIASEQEIVFHYKPSGSELISGDSPNLANDYDEIGSARGDVIMPGTAYLRTELTTIRPSGSWLWSNAFTSPALNVSFADLEIVDVAIPQRIVVGEAVDFSVTVRNRGNEAVYNRGWPGSSFTASLYLSIDGEFEPQQGSSYTSRNLKVYPSKTHWQSWVDNNNGAVVSIAPGASHVFNFRYNYFGLQQADEANLKNIKGFYFNIGYRNMATNFDSRIDNFYLTDTGKIVGDFTLTEVPRPDLKLEIMDFTLVNREGAMVPYRITNVGDAPLLPQDLEIVTYFGSNIKIPNVALAPGEISTGSGYWKSVDAYGYKFRGRGIVSQNFTLKGALEKNTGNNSVIKQFSSIDVPNIIPLGPNHWNRKIGIDDLLKPPLIAGSTVTTHWEVYNTEGEQEQIREDAFYWSKDATLDANDTLAARVTRTLHRDRSTTVTEASVTLPAAGDWYLLMRVDDGNTIVETNESDNVMASPLLQVAPLGRDLAIGAMTVSSSVSVIAGEPLEVSWNALNVGDVAVSGSRTERVVLRNGGQQFIYDFTYDDLLQPGASKSRTQLIQLPATISGTWDLSVIVDPDNTMVEPGGENNNEAPAPVQVNIAAGRNLVVSEVQGPSIAVADQEVQVDWRVRNTGGGAAIQGWNDSIYLSLDAALDHHDILLKAVANQSLLAAGAEYAASALVRLPDNIAQNYRILVVTDASGQVAEAVEIDNVTASESFLVTDTPPQLVASALTMPTSMLSNVPTAISWKVTNSGTGPVGNVSWTDSIFISADAVFDAQDERVADFTYRGPLAAGENAAVTRHENITLKDGLAGSFYFFVVTDSWNRIYEYGYEEDNPAFRLNGNNEIAPVEIFATNPPDLEVTALSLSTSTALSGQVITAQATIANNGAAALSQNARWTDQFYLSSDQYLDAQDISLGWQRRENGLAVGNSYTVNLELPLGDLANGTYYVIAVADQARETLDFDRDNNILVSDPLVVQRLPADLQVSNVQAPTFLAANVPSEVSYVVSNTGTGLTTRSSWTDHLWISKDDVLGNDDDILVGTFQHTAPLAAGASRSVKTSITPPLSAVGSYRLFVVTDANSAVPEYSGPAYGGETNNVATGPLTTVLQTLADLVVSNLEALDTVRPGQVVSVTWQVNNQGVGPTNVGAWKDAFFISKTGLIDQTAVRLNAVEREGVLATGESYTGSALLEIPPDLQTGDYHLIVMADWPEYPGVGVLEGARESANESNNTFSRPLTLAGAPMRPDLRVSNFQSPQNGIGGLPVTLSWRVENVGEAIAKPGFYDLVYLSLDGALNPTDILLGAVKREAPLNPGEADLVSATFTIPLGYVGAYHVILLAGDDLPNETARADNLIVAQQTMLIREAHVDLQVVSTTAPTSADFNEATSISYTVKNNGPDNIARRTWHDRVFLSTDAVLDIGDTQLATVRQDRALGAGASYTAEVTAPLQGITPGTYYVIVAADFAKSLNETNESNNALAAEPPLAATMPALGYGATATASLPQSGALLYYRLEVPAGDAFRVTLDGTGTDGAAALYVAFNRIPKPGNADHSGVVGYTLDQTIVVPQTQAGTYFIAIRGEALRQDTPFTLSVQKMDFAVTATSVEVLGNTGPATLRIHGALFDASTRFFLKGPDDVVVEGRVRQMTNAGEAVATFFLEDAPVGSYQLVALKGQQTADFAKTIQVKKDFAGKVVADFNGPAALLNGSSPSVNFGYSNAGGADLMAPLFILTDQRGGSIGSSVDDADARPMQILGASLQGNPILLEPGAAFTYRLVLKNVSAASGIEVSAKAVTTTDERVIDAVSWLELKNSLRPEKLSWKDWTTYWDRIRPQLGKTWGEYVVNVNGMMVALTAANEPPVRDVRELFRRLHAIDGNVAPDVSGKLLDSVTSQPLAGVEVRLRGITATGESFIAGKAITGVDGVFVIPKVVWGSYTLETDQTFDLNGDGTIDPAPIVNVLAGPHVTISDPIRVVPEEAEAAPVPDIGGIRFATDASGRLHGVWLAGTDIVHATYDGTSWSPATVIASASVVTELKINFSPKLLDDTIPALLVTWVGEKSNAATFANRLNAREVFALVGRLGPGTNVDWSDAFAVTNDSVRDRSLSVQILPDGDALLSFLKEDWSVDDDSDVYYTRLDLFSINLPGLNSLSASSTAMPPRSQDFVLNRNDYEINEFPVTNQTIFRQEQYGFEFNLNKATSLDWLKHIAGDGQQNELKWAFSAAYRERSLLVMQEQLKQAIVLVKKSNSSDVFGRLTTKDVQIFHRDQIIGNVNLTAEAKISNAGIPILERFKNVPPAAEQKFSINGFLGLTVGSTARFGSNAWQTDKLKVNAGVSFQYHHPTGLLQLLKGLSLIVPPAVPYVNPVVKAIEEFRDLLKEKKIGELSLGVGALGSFAGTLTAKDFPALFALDFEKFKVDFLAAARGYVEFKASEKWGSNNLQDVLKVKATVDAGIKAPLLGNGDVGVFVNFIAYLQMLGFTVGYSAGYSNVPGWTPDTLFGNSVGYAPSLPSAAINLPNPSVALGTLSRNPGASTGTASVYPGQSLVSNVAGDLFEDGAASLTTLDDGRVLAVWARSSSSTELGNRLYSAIYDGAAWSQPAEIVGTFGINDGVKAVKGLNGRVSIIWAQADAQSLQSLNQVTLGAVGDALRTNKMLHMDFDGSGFSAPSEITSPTGKIGALDAIVQPDGSTLLSWVVSQFDQNNNRSDSVYQSSWNGAQWTAPGLIVSNVAVQALQLQSIGGKAHVFWTGSQTAGDDETSQLFVQRLNAGTWSAAENFAPSSPPAPISPSNGNGSGTVLTASTAQAPPASLPALDVPPWPAINIDDFYNIGKDQSLSLKNLLSNDAGTAEEKSKMEVIKVNGQGPGTFTVTSKGGREATITVTKDGKLSFTPGAAFATLWENQVDVVRFLYVINDVGSLFEGQLLTEDLRTSVVEINVFGEDQPPEPPEPPEPPGPGPFGPYSPPVFWSQDPNDILGPVGHGPENWISANTPLGYTIRFENMAEATAPARKVVITQILDTDLDARSLRFGDIGFGDVVLDVPEGASYISQRLDLRQTRGVYVDVLATVDITTRTAMWILTAIDPETGDVPQDGSVGFLPPNGAAGEGQGFVKYRISAQPEAQNGARIDAAARIVFDNEAPLVTPSIFNTIDRVSPTSAVKLAGVTVEGKISLTWAGTDGMTGSGIASYTILVAKDGGPFAVWLEDTASTAAIFNGESGSSYAFYSLARDHSGLRELPPATPDVNLIIPGIPQGAVAGTVFDDLNQNGLRESGEPVLAGATVFLDADGDGLLDSAEISTTTSAAGGFNLAGVPSGAYKLRVVDGTGTVLATRDLSISSGQQLANLGVGAFTPGRISGIVFDDTDGDGLQEPGEAALSGAVLFLDDNGNGLKDTGERAVTTGADGVFVFGGLGAGPRKLVLDAVNGRLPTGSSTRSTTVTSGLDLTVNFGTVVPGKIEGILFEDANGDGVRNGTERGLSGWTVFLDGNGNGLRDAGEAQLTTGMTGSYSFTGLKPGSYTVSVTRPSGWLQTSDPGAALGTVQVQSASTSALGTTAAGRGAAAALSDLSALQSDPAFAGITGAGIGIVVVDSGIDADHPFFGPDVDGNGVADRIVAQYDFVDNDANADDAFGHGTHIAGIVASQDATYGGVAPEANIVALRVLDTKGSGSFTKLEAALQWTLTNADRYNIRVVNLSMGDNQNWQNSTSLYGIGDELAALAARDILVIAAAGNGFYTFNSKPGVSYPAADPNVIAVGAVWATESSSFSAAGAIDFTTAPDRIAALSQRHAGLVDVFAPGMQIVSAGIGGGTAVLSGTSQAAGFTTGVAALAQQIALDKLGRPLKVQEFIDLLSSTSRGTLDGDDENDNVTNTSKSYPLLDVLELAQAIAKLNPGSTGVTVTPSVAPASFQVAAPGSISVSPGSNILAPIGLFGSFAVSGSVFLDANRNGVYDSGEAMLAGTRLVLDMDGNGAFSSADQMVVTTSGGGFTFAGLGPGSKQLGVQTNDGQMFWLSSLSSTSRVNINSLQLPFQLPEVDAPSDGDAGGSTGPGGLPDINPVYDPGRIAGPRKGADWDWASAPNAGAVRLPETSFVTDPGRNTGSGKGSDGGGPINSGAISRSPAMTTSFSLGGDRSNPMPGLPNREPAISPALTPDGTPAPAVASTGANRMADERTSSSSMPSPSEPMSSKARADQLRMAQPAQPQSSQSDQQRSSATEPLADPRQALDAAVESLGRVLPAQEARRPQPQSSQRDQQGSSATEPVADPRKALDAAVESPGRVLPAQEACRPQPQSSQSDQQGSSAAEPLADPQQAPDAAVESPGRVLPAQEACRPQPQSSQSDQQRSSATEPVADPRQALDAAVESLRRVLPAQEARRVLVAAPSDPVILLDESVFEPVPIRATTPESHPREDWVADFLTNAGKVMQGPGDELIVLAVGTAALQVGGKRQAPGREARQGRPRDAARPTERIA